MSLKLSDSKDSVIDKAIDLSFFDSIELPYTKVDFENFYTLGMQKFASNKIKVEALLLEITKFKSQLEKNLMLKNTT